LPTASCTPCPKVPAQLSSTTNERTSAPARLLDEDTRQRIASLQGIYSFPAERAIPAPPGRSASSRRVFGLSSDVVGEVGGATDGCWMHSVFFADNFCNHQHSVTPGQLTLACAPLRSPPGATQSPVSLDRSLLRSESSMKSVRRRCPRGRCRLMASRCVTRLLLWFTRYEGQPRPERANDRQSFGVITARPLILPSCRRL
jgi:hypothetical protein